MEERHYRQTAPRVTFCSFLGKIVRSNRYKQFTLLKAPQRHEKNSFRCKRSPPYLLYEIIILITWLLKPKTFCSLCITLNLMIVIDPYSPIISMAFHYYLMGEFVII